MPAQKAPASAGAFLCKRRAANAGDILSMEYRFPRLFPARPAKFCGLYKKFMHKNNDFRLVDFYGKQEEKLLLSLLSWHFWHKKRGLFWARCIKTASAENRPSKNIS
ncbi:MAG: hypothetical protein RR215_06380 [Ruthenibacterium sp.]